MNGDLEHPVEEEEIKIKTYTQDPDRSFISMGLELDDEIYHKSSDLLPTITDDRRMESIIVYFPGEDHGVELTETEREVYTEFLNRTLNGTGNNTIKKQTGVRGKA